jgi:hypothetical protein
MGFYVMQILIDHGHVLLVMLLTLLVHQRLVLENVLHNLVFHSSVGMTARVNTDRSGVDAATMTARVTT